MRRVCQSRVDWYDSAKRLKQLTGSQCVKALKTGLNLDHYSRKTTVEPE